MSEPDAFHSASIDRVPGWRDHLLAAFLAAGCILLCLFPSIARAQQADLPSLEDGPLGLAGMLAGLLIFALIGLYHHNRRSRSTLARLGALTDALEQRDDKIWQLEERLARATDDTMAERIKEAIHAAYVTSPGTGNVPWLDQRQAEANVLAAIRAAAADEQEADSGPA